MLLLIAPLVILLNSYYRILVLMTALCKLNQCMVILQTELVINVEIIVLLVQAKLHAQIVLIMLLLLPGIIMVYAY